MTKRKPPGELRKRSRKAGAENPGVAIDNDGQTWIAVELRRRRLDMGRAKGSLKRACEFLAADLRKTTQGALADKTIKNRYDRAAKRRKHDPDYAALLDGWLNVSDRVSQRIADRDGAGVMLPIFLSPPRK